MKNLFELGYLISLAIFTGLLIYAALLPQIVDLQMWLHLRKKILVDSKTKQYVRPFKQRFASFKMCHKTAGMCELHSFGMIRRDENNGDSIATITWKDSAGQMHFNIPYLKDILFVTRNDGGIIFRNKCISKKEMKALIVNPPKCMLT